MTSLLERSDMTVRRMIDDRAKELGRFLRTRRAKLGPVDVGIEADPRRRASGLRREEVARLAHVSTSWYVHLEQGRRIPSPTVLDNLSTALRLNRAEHLYLHSLAASTVPRAMMRATPDTESVATARALVELNDHNALPVFALDGRGAVLAANDATGAWYSDFSERTGSGTNFVWWLYTDPAARDKIVDWRSAVRDYTEGLRFSAAASRTDDDTAVLLDRLDHASAEFRVDWGTHDVADPGTRRRTLVHPDRGPVTLHVVTVQPTVRPSIIVAFHLDRPAPTPTG